MAAIVLNRTTKLDSTIRETLGDDLVFTGEQNAHKFVIQCTLNSSHINLTGTVTAQFMCPDNATVPINGTIENGKAVLTLPAECYEVPGRYRLSVFNTQGGATVCIYTGVGTVRRTSTGKVVDRGIIPNLNELQQAAQNIAGVENIDITQTKSGNVITVTTTDRNNVKTNKTITEPTATMSKAENGDYTITVTDANGSTSYTIEDTEAAVRKKATIEAVSRVKTALGNPLTITDGMDAPAVKTVVTLEPKQDLHGYDHPWVGGSGKNLYNPSKMSSLSAYGITVAIANDGTITLNGTATANAYFSVSGLGLTFSNGSTISLNNPSTNSGVHVSLRSSDNSYYADIVANEINKTNTRGESDCDAVVIYVTTNTTLSNFTMKIQLEAGRTATSYEPYSNICPIEGYDTVRVTATGKNLFDPHTFVDRLASGTTTTVMPDGAIHVVGTATTQNRWAYEGTQMTLEAGSYAMARYGDYAGVYGFRIYAPDGTVSITLSPNDSVEYKTFTLPKVTDCSFSIVLNVNQVCDFYAKLAIWRVDDIPDTWEPFGNATSLSVAQAAGATVYGGTVTLNEDGSGTLVVDRAIYTADGNANIDLLTTFDTGNVFWDRTATLPIADYATNYISSQLSVGAARNTNASPYGDYVYSGTIRYKVPKSIAETSEQFKSYLSTNPIQICYPLATPTTYTLTADQLRTLTGENHVWTDGTKLELTYRADKYADVEKFLNAIPTGTKTGDPAVFADGADDLPFEKLTIAVEPHQEGSGDPSPDNIRPITGWDEVKVTRCGKNLLNPDDVTQVTTANGTRYGAKFTAPGTYTISAQNGYTINAGNIYVTKYDGSAYSSGVSIVNGTSKFNPFSITITQGQWLIVHGGSGISEATAKDVIKSCSIQLEFGTATSYEEPVRSSTPPISLKGLTGSTVYGGTVTINRDGTGSVVVDRAYIEMSGFQYESGATRFWYANVPTPYGATVSRTGSFVCDKYKAVTDGRAISGVSTGMCYFGAQKSNGHCDFYVHDTRYTDAATFNATVGAVAIAYKLATPITYTLTAPQLTSLLGNNTVWCDAGQVTVKYKRDIGKALDAMVASLIEAGLYVDMGAVVVEPGA